MNRHVLFWSVWGGAVLWGMLGGWVLAEESSPAVSPGKPACEESPEGAPKPPSLPTPPEQETLPLPAPPSSVMKQLVENSRKAEMAILKALAEPSEGELHELPLRDLIEYWQQRHKVPICLDRRALEEANLEDDHLITIRIKDASFLTVLEQVLQQLDLGWTIQRGTLCITSQDQAAQFLVSRVYAVDHLLSESSEHAEAHRQLEELVEVITGTIRPQSWSDVGGPGRITPLVLRGKKRLVIQQSWPVHLEIGMFLEELAHSLAEPAPQGKLPSVAPEPKGEIPLPLNLRKSP